MTTHINLTMKISTPQSYYKIIHKVQQKRLKSYLKQYLILMTHHLKTGYQFKQWIQNNLTLLLKLMKSNLMSWVFTLRIKTIQEEKTIN